MSGKSYSNKADSHERTVKEGEHNWAQAADNAAKKAEESVEQIKRNAQEQLNDSKLK